MTMQWDSNHGEEVMRGAWSKCVVCGSPTNLSTVCFDLRCEKERNA